MVTISNITSACIVLHNPSLERLDKNISSIKDQVHFVIIVDNGSSNIENIEKKYKNESNILIIKNGTNLGIASALNIGFEKAKSIGDEWVITLDQDSIADKELIKKYGKHINDSVGIICPQIIDINLDNNVNTSNEIERIERAEDLITSGSLVRISLWEAVGKYDDRLFIDYVDTDFQERILRNANIIIRTHETYLLHEVGQMRLFRIGAIKILCSNHNAFRRYYMVRNRLYYRKKYFGHKSYFKEKIRLIMGDIKILLFEKEKKEKILASIKGQKDYKKLLY